MARGRVAARQEGWWLWGSNRRQRTRSHARAIVSHEEEQRAWTIHVAAPSRGSDTPVGLGNAVGLW